MHLNALPDALRKCVRDELADGKESGAFWIGRKHKEMEQRHTE